MNSLSRFYRVEVHVSTAKYISNITGLRSNPLIIIYSDSLLLIFSLYNIMPYGGGRRLRKKRGNMRRSAFKSVKSKASKMVEKGIDYNKLVGNAGYLAKTVYGLYGMINSEKLYLDATASASAIPNTALITPLTNPAQGDGVSGRTGQKVLAQDILIRGSCLINASATSSKVRLLLLVDKMMNGTYPTGTDILQTASVYSPLDIDDSQGRFVILYDKLYNLDIDSKDGFVFKIYKKLNFHIMYKGTDGAEASLGKNQVFILAISDEATNTPTISYYSRFKYCDN